MSVRDKLQQLIRPLHLERWNLERWNLEQWHLEPRHSEPRHLEQLRTDSRHSLQDLFVRMAADQGPEEREQLQLPRHRSQCPLRRLLPQEPSLTIAQAEKKLH